MKDSWRRRSSWSSGDDGRKEREAETDCYRDDGDTWVLNLEEKKESEGL